MVRSMVGFALGEKFGLVWICVIGDCVAHSVMMVCVCVCVCSRVRIPLSRESITEKAWQNNNGHLPRRSDPNVGLPRKRSKAGIVAADDATLRRLLGNGNATTYRRKIWDGVHR